MPLRAKREVLDDINHHWNRWLAQEGLPEEDFPRKPSLRMDLLDRLVELEPYRYLNAIAYDATTTFGTAKFITVFRLESILEEEVNVIPPHTNIRFQPPETLEGSKD
ncbi:hypothetical protein DET50_11679 [Marinobacter pelagius]|uniref:Uncharacterized protein n=1 Tax=Marinobacter pelagius TaxID=379482 RepID=A0A366GKX6_9GAMM|nr:hypothetical protein DET50_11679 [Marinobacter pelagius]